MLGLYVSDHPLFGLEHVLSDKAATRGEDVGTQRQGGQVTPQLRRSLRQTVSLAAAEEGLPESAGLCGHVATAHLLPVVTGRGLRRARGGDHVLLGGVTGTDNHQGEKASRQVERRLDV